MHRNLMPVSKVCLVMVERCSTILVWLTSSSLTEHLRAGGREADTALATWKRGVARARQRKSDALIRCMCY